MPAQIENIRSIYTWPSFRTFLRRLWRHPQLRRAFVPAWKQFRSNLIATGISTYAANGTRLGLGAAAQTDEMWVNTDPHVKAAIDTLYTPIAASAKADVALWDYANRYAWTANTSACYPEDAHNSTKSVGHVVEFISKRIRWIDSNVDALLLSGQSAVV